MQKEDFLFRGKTVIATSSKKKKAGKENLKMYVQKVKGGYIECEYSLCELSSSMESICSFGFFQTVGIFLYQEGMF